MIERYQNTLRRYHVLMQHLNDMDTFLLRNWSILPMWPENPEIRLKKMILMLKYQIL